MTGIRSQRSMKMVAGFPSTTRSTDPVQSPRQSVALTHRSAVLALLLASVGIYGLLAYMVAQRSHEIGVRMALGARPSIIGKMIVSRGVGLAGIGVVIGLILSGILAPLISTLLYGVRPLDPEVFLAVPLPNGGRPSGELHSGAPRGKGEPGRRTARELKPQDAGLAGENFCPQGIHSLAFARSLHT
jgi:ABC-type antimicrobial peptide transport system permease subunit